MGSLHLACSRCAVAAGGSLRHKGQVLPLEGGWQAQRRKGQSGTGEMRLSQPLPAGLWHASGLQPEETKPAVRSPGAFSQPDRPLRALEEGGRRERRERGIQPTGKGAMLRPDKRGSCECWLTDTGEDDTKRPPGGDS